MASNSANAISSASKAVRVLSNREARRLLLARYRLSGKRPDKLVDLIAGLGYVQIDSIRVVERAQHHILFSRDTRYRPRQLDRLAAERTLFEHWTHDASLIPIAFYPHWTHRFERAERRVAARKGWWEERLGGARVIDQMRKHVEAEGPILVRHIEEKEGGTGPWWGWSKQKAALEYLWHTGELAIAGREGFQKIYDLAERVIPARHRGKTTRAETINWACSGALERMGAATTGEIADFWALATREEVGTWTKAELAAQRLIEVELQDVNGKAWKAFARPALLDEPDTVPDPPGRLRLLSPFDPLLRNRPRTKRFFGFDYRIEVFVPAPKRKYGYYVFPILEGERFTGRIDLKADRVKNVLRVQGLWLERGYGLSKARRARLDAELARHARLAGVAEIEFPKSALR